MKTTTERKIAVMTAAEKNGAAIQCRNVNSYNEKSWLDCDKEPDWDWLCCEYRVKPAEPLRCWVQYCESSGSGDPFMLAWPTLKDAEEGTDSEHYGIREFVEVVK